MADSVGPLLYIQRVKDVLGVKSDEELGEKIGLSKQAIANWRMRKRIPLRFQQRMLDEYGVRYADWSLDHEYGTGDAVYAISLYIYEMLAATLPQPLSVASRRTLGQLFPQIVLAVSQKMKGIGSDRGSVETLIALFMSFVDSGKFPEIDQFRADIEAT